MTEPVKLVNTNETFDRTSVQTWYRRSVKGEQKQSISAVDVFVPCAKLHICECCATTCVSPWLLTLFGWLPADVEPKCPRTGQPLKGWIIFQADEELRKRIVAWADKHKCNLDLISNINASMEREAAQAAPPYLSACRGGQAGVHPRHPSQLHLPRLPKVRFIVSCYRKNQSTQTVRALYLVVVV